MISEDLSEPQSIDGVEKNALKVECPKCGSVILQAGVGVFVADYELDIPLMYKSKEEPCDVAKSHADDTVEMEKLTRWWYVRIYEFLRYAAIQLE